MSRKMLDDIIVYAGAEPSVSRILIEGVRVTSVENPGAELLRS
jgi:hypothetical protein